MSSHEVEHRWNRNLILTTRSAKIREIGRGLVRMARKPKKKNLCAERRDPKDPYEIWVSQNGEWEWHVLKKYQTATNEAKNQYAIWYCAVYSPITKSQTLNGFECGDVYVRDIKSQATLKPL